MAGIAGYACTLTEGVGNTVVGKAKDVELKADGNPIDTTTRADAGWKNFVAGLREWGADIEQLWVYSDTGLTDIKNAFINGTSLAVKFDDGGGHGFNGTVLVTSLKFGQPLNGAVVLAVSVKGQGALTPY